MVDQDHRDLIDAELAVNEGGSGQLKNGRYLINEVQASEKVYQDFRLESKNPGGHSSRPLKHNAIYRLANGLARLGRYDFRVNMSEVTRAYFERMAGAGRCGTRRRHARASRGPRPIGRR
jgi:hypothetical protein